MIPWLLFKRDIALALRRGGAASALVFCLLAFALFAFSLGPDDLRANASRVLCVAVALSCLLALPTLFERDHADGTLEQYLVQPVALEWLVFARLAAFWLTSAAPLVLLSPLLALMGGLPGGDAARLMLVLLLATPTLCAIGALGAALLVGVRRGGFTQALIVLPLYIPPLIFAAGSETGSALTLLAGMSLASVPLACLLVAALLRLTQD